MLLKDYLSRGNIFEFIDDIRPLPFIPTADSESLNLKLVLGNGNKTLFESFELIDLETLAVLLSMDFSDKWDSLLTVATSGLENLNTRREIKETISREEIKNNSHTMLNKVSGYNSDVLIDNDGSDGTGTDDLTGETVRTLTDQQIDLANSFKMLNLLQQNSIIQTVVNDVAGYLTLSIYK